MTIDRYYRMAIFLHWSIALLLVFQFMMGVRMATGPAGLSQYWVYQLHKSVGFLILAASLLRLAVRLRYQPPPALDDKPAVHGLAKAVHLGLYAVMIGGPLTGWALVSTASTRVPTKIFGLVPVPHLPLPNAFGVISENAHTIVAWTGAALLALHVGGAVRHQFFRKKPILLMLPPYPASFSIGAIWSGIGAAMAAALALGWFVAVPAGEEIPVRSKADAAPALAANTTASRMLLPVGQPDQQATTPSPVSPAAETPNTVAVVPLRRWTLSDNRTLRFSTSFDGSAIDGSFGRWSGDIRFSKDHLDTSTIDINIDLASVRSGDDARDDTLRGDEFFDVARHATARFRARGIRRLDGDRFRATGTLSLHDVSRPVTINFTLRGDEKHVTVNGAASLDRSAFGVGTGQWASFDQIPAAVGIRFSFSANAEKVDGAD